MLRAVVISSVLLFAFAACKPKAGVTTSRARSAPKPLEFGTPTIYKTMAEEEGACTKDVEPSELALVMDTSLKVSDDQLKVKTLVAISDIDEGARKIQLDVEPVTPDGVKPDDFQNLFPEYEFCDYSKPERNCQGGEDDRENAKFVERKKSIPLDDRIHGTTRVRVRICVNDVLIPENNTGCGDWVEADFDLETPKPLDTNQALARIDEQIRENELLRAKVIGTLQEPAKKYLQVIKDEVGEDYQKLQKFDQTLRTIAFNLVYANAVIQGAAATDTMESVNESIKEKQRIEREKTKETGLKLTQDKLSDCEDYMAKIQETRDMLFPKSDVSQKTSGKTYRTARPASRKPTRPELNPTSSDSNSDTGTDINDEEGTWTGSKEGDIVAYSMIGVAAFTSIALVSYNIYKIVQYTKGNSPWRKYGAKNGNPKMTFKEWHKVPGTKGGARWLRTKISVNVFLVIVVASLVAAAFAMPNFLLTSSPEMANARNNLQNHIEMVDQEIFRLRKHYAQWNEERDSEHALVMEQQGLDNLEEIEEEYLIDDDTF